MFDLLKVVAVVIFTGLVYIALRVTIDIQVYADLTSIIMISIFLIVIVFNWLGKHSIQWGFILFALLCVGGLSIVAPHIIILLDTAPGYIEGYAEDDDGNPVPNTVLTLRGSAGHLDHKTTDSTGYYKFSKVPKGKYAIFNGTHEVKTGNVLTIFHRMLGVGDALSNRTNVSTPTPPVSDSEPTIIPSMTNTPLRLPTSRPTDAPPTSEWYIKNLKGDLVRARTCPRLSCTIHTNLSAGTLIFVVEIVDGDITRGTNKWLKIAWNETHLYVHISLATEKNP